MTEAARVGQGRAPSTLSLAVAFGAVYIFWGLNFLAIRIAVQEIPPFLMMGTRSVIAGALLFAWSRFEPSRARIDGRDWLNALAAGTLFFLCCHGALAWAEARVTAGLAAIALATIPLWFVTIEALLPGGSWPPPVVAVGLAVGFGGTVLLLWPGEGPSLTGWTGLALAFSSFAWAAGAVVTRRAGVRHSPACSTGMQLLAGGVLLLLASFARSEPSRQVIQNLSLRGGLAFGYLVVIGSIVGFTAFNWLLRVSTPGRVGTYAYVNPVVAVLAGYFFLHEIVTARVLLATLIILGAVVTINLGREGRAA